MSPLGLPGDEHVYPAHGGADQALLVYSLDNYGYWRDHHDLDLPPAGAFAENLTVEGLTEHEVCIGDTFAIGGVVAQVTSPRNPCYKIGVHYDDRLVPLVMQDKRSAGYLMRILTEGDLEAGLDMVLVDRPGDTMTVAEAVRVVSRDRDDWATIERLAAIPELADAMRRDLAGRLERRDRGDDAPRLYGEGEGEPID